MGDRNKGLRETVLRFLVVAGIVALTFEAHCLLAAYRHLDGGDKAAAAGRADLARLEWETAAARPAPFNGYARGAMARLLSLEQNLEASGRTAEALRVCFSIRGIAASTGGYRSYYDDERTFVEERIPRLAASLGVELSPDRYTLYRPIRSLAAHLAVMCFAGFVISGFAAIRGEGRIRLLRGSLSSVMFLLWILFLRLS